jgi:hypothetical protein
MRVSAKTYDVYAVSFDYILDYTNNSVLNKSSQFQPGSGDVEVALRVK